MNEVTPLLPEQFWTLTPFECGTLTAGGVKREQREWERWAWQTAWLLNVSGKSMQNEITADELLGRPKPVQVIDPGAKEAELQRRLEALNLRKE